MITLHSFGARFGLRDPSPFVTKVEVLLRMAGQPYVTVTKGLAGAPKGKLPFIEDGGRVIGDSAFIRRHLEKTYGVDFDAGLSAQHKAVALSFERLCEDHLYWAVVYERWLIPANFTRGPARFFDFAPALLRPLIRTMVVRQIRRNLWGQGLGRHTYAEIAELAMADIDALDAQLAGGPYLVGASPCGADATVYAFVAGLLCPHFDGSIAGHARTKANLIAYAERCKALWFPEDATAR